MLASYYEKLGDFEPDVLERMRREASDFYVNGFPSAGQLRKIAQAIASRSEPLSKDRQISEGFDLTEEDRKANQERIREIVAGLGSNLVQ